MPISLQQFLNVEIVSLGATRKEVSVVDKYNFHVDALILSIQTGLLSRFN